MLLRDGKKYTPKRRPSQGLRPCVYLKREFEPRRATLARTGRGSFILTSRRLVEKCVDLSSTLIHNACHSNKARTMSKSIHIKPEYLNSPSYRKAKRDLIFHYVIAGVMLIIGLVAVWVY
jgi:hypothetical protein